MTAYLRALPGVLLLACAPPEEEEMNTPVKCTVLASTSFEPTTRVVRGTGTLTCEAAADVSVKVCLYARSAGQTSWGAPLQCSTLEASARTTLSTEVAVALPPGAAKMYRTLVSARVDSVDQPEQASALLTAP